MNTVDPREHAGRVSGMFGRIAGWYDFLNHFLSLGQDIVWRRKLVAAVKRGSKGVFLDLAAGTMDVTRELLRRNPRSQVVAVDFARPMLEKGAPKLGSGKYRTQAVEADGRSIPMAEKSVDSVTIAFGIRNIKPREEAYAEILRVLEPGGRLAILEFGSSRRPIMKGLYNFYLNTLLPAVGKVVSGDSEAYRYLAETIGEFPTPEELELELRRAGFVNVAHESLTFGIVNIHIAEKRLHEGDTFILGGKSETPASESKPKKKPVRSAARSAAPAEEAQPEPAKQDAAQGASNLSAALNAFEKASASAEKQKAKKKGAGKGAGKKASKKSETGTSGAAKKATAKKTAAKKTPAKTKSAAKTEAGKSTAKSTKKATASKAKSKTASKDSEKSTAKKPAAKKTAAKKAAPKKRTAAKKKTAAKSPAKKKTASKTDKK